jgi:hypothetical protein
MHAGAVDNGFALTNPTAGLSRRGQKRSDRLSLGGRVKAIRPFSESELAAFPEAARSDTEYFPLFLALARTGLRPGEAFALKWHDLDFSRRETPVERALSRGQIGSTKTGTTRRVDMSDELRAALSILFVQREKDTVRRGWGDVPEWVFVNLEGNQLDESRVGKRFARAMRAAGLSGHRVYDLRHGFATLLLAKRGADHLRRCSARACKADHNASVVRALATGQRKDLCRFARFCLLLGPRVRRLKARKLPVSSLGGCQKWLSKRKPRISIKARLIVDQQGPRARREVERCA